MISSCVEAVGRNINKVKYLGLNKDKQCMTAQNAVFNVS
jgi:hypothetical protein